MRTIRRTNTSALTAMLLCLAAALLTALPAPAADRRPTVAILPLVTYADKDIGYLAQGIRSMLTSRLVADAGVEIRDAGVEAGAIQYPQDLKKVGREKGIDYLIGGSITALGGGASLDLYVTDSHTPAKARHFYATADKDADIIRSIDRLAREISTTIFGARNTGSSGAEQRPAAATPPSPSRTRGFDPTMHPERALFAGQGQNPAIRPFRRAFRQFTKSQNLHFFVRAMAAGDIDGNGEDEIVIARADGIRCYRRADNRLQLITSMPVAKGYAVVDLSLADLDGDQQEEIYVTAAAKGAPYGAGFRLEGERLAPLFVTKEFFIRAIDLPVLGPALIGQRPGDHAPLEKKIYALRREGGRILAGEPLGLPRGADIFNFAYADVDGDGSKEIVLLDEKFFLQVFRPGGTQVWRSSAIFGGSPITVGKERDAADADWDARNALYPDEWKQITVSPRIVVADLNGDKADDVVVVRNAPKYSTMLANVRSYDASEIYGLSWNGVGLDVLWRTRRIDGFITDIALRNAAGGSGADKVLYASLIMPTGMMDLFSKATSSVLTFDISTTPGPQAQE